MVVPLSFLPKMPTSKPVANAKWVLLLLYSEAKREVPW